MAATNKKKRPAPKGPSGAKKPAPAPRSAPPTEQEIIRRRQILGIVLSAVAVLLLVNFILAPDPSAEDVGTIGVLSLYLNRLLRFFAGTGAIVLPVFLLGYGVMFCVNRSGRGYRGRSAGLLMIFLSFLGCLHLGETLSEAEGAFKAYLHFAAAGGGGGVLGALLDFALLRTVGKVGAIIIFVALILIGLLLFLQTSLGGIARAVKQGGDKARSALRPPEDPGPAPSMVEPVDMAAVRLGDPASRVPVLDHNDHIDSPAAEPEVRPLLREEPEPPYKKFTPPPPPENAFVANFMPSISDSGEQALKEQEPETPPQPEPETAPAEEGRVLPLKRKRARTENKAPAQAAGSGAGYILPPHDLVEMVVKVKNPRLNKLVADGIGILETTLDSFGVKATVTQVVAGPAVTRYELQPAPGVKVARITSLSDDIALSLAAQSVRIEAPIPGKSAIGIEVARKEVDIVYFREMIDSESFRGSQARLSYVLGKNIAGECVVGDLAKMPHLLIAGATGSGKSICINNIICSLLYKATPDQVKIMLIDPKKVEMMQYAQLPHLIAPVVNDSKKAANALKWVVNEMESRYSLFVGSCVKDFDGYNQSHQEEPLPHIVVIIDELADLMMVARHDVEDSICRLAQMARAAGIHLVVATQRPSVDVITGLIKANIPSRIAFAVSSYTDSRTILDMGGAEKLLGRGDMLYSPVGANKPMRIQGSYIDPADVNRLVDYCAQQAAPTFSPAAVEAANSADKLGPTADKDDDGDELLYDAGSLIISSGQASTSFLQRRLAIGNPRAARIMDILESKGVVGGPNGSKPREILMTLPEFEERFG